jgi:RNA polymerase-binding transcription factor DksA
MAKKKKKSPAKVARKKTAPKARPKAKAAAKGKKAKPGRATRKAVKKAVTKKSAGKKVAAVKKTVAKKAVIKKKEGAKVVMKKTNATAKAADTSIPKAKAKAAPNSTEAAKVQPEKPRVAAVKKEVASKPAPSEARPLPSLAQINMFQMPNQRPIAHKPVRATSDDTRTRYSEVELKEFEKLILEKMEKAREEYKILKDTLNRNNDEGTDATSGGNTKVLEDGAETAEKENLSQLAARQQKYITNLENALVRIKNGTYGICSVTGKLISKERLIAVPHTTQSIEAKMMKQD